MIPAVLYRCLAWALLVAITVATLSPIEVRPVSGAPSDMERFLAFVLLGGAFCLAYPKRSLGVLLVLVGLAGLLEFAQDLVPGRHGAVGDAIWKASGAVLGATFALLLA